MVHTSLVVMTHEHFVKRNEFLQTVYNFTVSIVQIKFKDITELIIQIMCTT